MKMQKVLSQMERQDKSPEKQLNEVEMQPSRTRIQNIVSEDDSGSQKKKEAKIEKLQEMFTKDLEELKNKQAEMNNTPGGIHSRKTDAEKWINDLEDRMVEITATEQNIEERMKRNEDSLTDLWDIKCTNIFIIGDPRRRREKKDLRKIFEEIITGNFPNMEKKIINEVQEGQIVPGRTNPRKNTAKHKVIKLTKVKGRNKISKATREKQQITYKGTSFRLSADFSTETLQAKREWNDTFKVMKGKKL